MSLLYVESFNVEATENFNARAMLLLHLFKGSQLQTQRPLAQQYLDYLRPQCLQQDSNSPIFKETPLHLNRVENFSNSFASCSQGFRLTKRPPKKFSVPQHTQSESSYLRIHFRMGCSPHTLTLNQLTPFVTLPAQTGHKIRLIDETLLFSNATLRILLISWCPHCKGLFASTLKVPMNIPNSMSVWIPFSCRLDNWVHVCTQQWMSGISQAIRKTRTSPHPLTTILPKHPHQHPPLTELGNQKCVTHPPNAPSPSNIPTMKTKQHLAQPPPPQDSVISKTHLKLTLTTYKNERTQQTPSSHNTSRHTLTYSASKKS